MTRTAILYAGTTAHVRTEPLINRFRYSTMMWLVDLDDLPVLPRGLRWLTAFRAKDHVGHPDSSIRENIVRKFAEDGTDVSDCRILMLAQPRGLGHVFNPISVHWAISAEGETRGMIAEVHNTYGGRHAYVLRPDSKGRDVVEKRLYVSPFFATDGHYSIQASDPGERITLSVTLQPEGGKQFIATLNTERQVETSVLQAAMRTAGSSLRTSLLIKWQGVRLWARRLPVQPRPAGHDHELTTSDPEPAQDKAVAEVAS